MGTKIPPFMYPDPHQAPQARPFDSVERQSSADRATYLVQTSLINEAEVARRHTEEAPDKCAVSRGRAMDVAKWNVAGHPYPITLVEANWFDGRWQRAYVDFNDGYHRVERALNAGVPAVWIEVYEYRFAPRGERPPDREGFGLGA